MKTPLLSSLVLVAAVAMACPGRAASMNKELKALDKKVDTDLAAGALTKPDGDQLKREISEVRSVETNWPRLTRATRRDLREKISEIHRDLVRMEGQAKALRAASPSLSPL